MRHVGLFLALLTLGGWAVSGQEVQHIQYEITVALDPEAHVLRGVESVTYPNTGQTALEALYFVLAPNLDRQPNPKLDPVVTDAGYWRGFDPAWLEVSAVRDEAGQALAWAYEDGPAAFQTYSLEHVLLRVQLPQPLTPGAQTRLEIEFETKFPASLSPDQSEHKGLYTWRFAWNPVAVPANELIDGSYLSDARPYPAWRYPAALYSVTLTVPAEFTVAAGTNVQEEIGQDAEAGTKTLRLSSDVPIRSVALAMGKGLRRYTLEVTEVPIHVYYGPGEEAAARQLATYAVEILAAYGARWGGYGYRQLSVVSSWVSGYFGMAADGLIVLGNSGFSEKDLTVAGMADRLLEYLLAHETAHQWWGMGVGTDFNAENYISEAFAEYLSITYFEDKYGASGPNLIDPQREGFLESAVENQFGYLNLRQHFSELPYATSIVRNRFDESVVKPQQDVNYLNTQSVRIYNKGYLVLRALAGLIGTEAMDQLLQKAYQQYNHRMLDTPTLQGLAESVSGQDLGPFFEDWIYGQAEVDYAIESVYSQPDEAGRHTTRVQLSRRGTGRLPVQVVVVSETGEKVTQTWNPEQDAPQLEFVTDAALKEVQVDPDSWTPDTKRLNNYFPTRLRIIPDGKADVPLDAYLIRFDPFNKALEGGFVLDYRWLVADGLLAFVYNQGRGNTIDGALFVGEQVLAEFGWNLTHFLNPDLGLKGTYWEPSHQLRLSISRRLGGEGDPVNYAGLSYSFNRLINARQVLQVGVVGDPFAFARFSGAALYQTLLWPHATLDVQAKAGYSLGAVPDFLSFSLAELNAFYERNGNQRVKRTFPGRYKGFLQLGLDFPMQPEMAYDVAGLALVRQIQGRLYLSAGQTWNPFDAFDLEATHVEVGFEATVSGQMFGGLLPFSVTAGAAMALSEGNALEAMGVEPYLRLSVPFL